MKFKTTRKAVLAGYKNVICVDYCELSNALNNPVAYTCGVCGWNADIYEIDDRTAIVSGYRPFGMHASSDIIKKYDIRIYDEQKARENLKAFCNEVLQGK